MAIKERRLSTPFAVISTPYIDSGGAGLISTLSVVVWNKDTTPLDLERKHQKFGVVGFDFIIGKSDLLRKMSGGACGSATLFCTLIDEYGSLVFYDEFAAAKDGYLEDGKSVHDLFLGLREPDLADALIKNELLVLQPRQLSPDSKLLTSNFRLNEKKIQDLGGVATGTLLTEQLRCLKLSSISAPPIKWYLSYVKGSNTAVLVVEGYARKNGACNFETAPLPPTKNNLKQCPISTSRSDTLLRAPKSNIRLHHVCLKCKVGDFAMDLASAFVIDGIHQQQKEETHFGHCDRCPEGYITPNTGMRTCSACDAGTTASPGASVCIPCSHGKTAEKASKVPCTSCPSGWYATPKVSLTAFSQLKEPSFCQACPSGWYQDRHGSTQGCIKCPKDTYSPTTGNIAHLLCLHCTPERTTRSSVPTINTIVNPVLTNNSATSAAAAATAAYSTVTSNVDTASTFSVFNTQPKIDTACFCKGTTVAERKAAANHYTDSKYNQDILKMYGSSCREWDNLRGSPYKQYCPADLNTCTQAGNWCRQKWCFVNDPEACAARGFDIAGGSVFSYPSGEPIKYYSYGLCGYPDCYRNEKNWETGVCPFGLKENEKVHCQHQLAASANDGIAISKESQIEVFGGFRTQQSCLCRAGKYYTEKTNSTHSTCIECPKGANCGQKGIDRDGLSLQESLPMPGFWRTDSNSDIFLDCKKPYYRLGEETSQRLAKQRCCPSCNLTASTYLVKNMTFTNNATTINNNNATNAPCLKGYTGPLCHVCNVDQDYVSSGNGCIFCDGGASLSYHIAMWFVIGICFSTCIFIVFVLVKPPKDHATSKKYDSILNNMKVLWSWGQLFSATPNTFGEIAWGEFMCVFSCY
jgi:hypothetical protein